MILLKERKNFGGNIKLFYLNDQEKQRNSILGPWQRGCERACPYWSDQMA